MTSEDFFASEAFIAMMKVVEERYGKIEYFTVCHVPEVPPDSDEEGDDSYAYDFDNDEVPDAYTDTGDYNERAYHQGEYDDDETLIIEEYPDECEKVL